LICNKKNFSQDSIYNATISAVGVAHGMALIGVQRTFIVSQSDRILIALLPQHDAVDRAGKIGETDQNRLLVSSRPNPLPATG